MWIPLHYPVPASLSDNPFANPMEWECLSFVRIWKDDVRSTKTKRRSQFDSVDDIVTESIEF